MDADKLNSLSVALFQEYLAWRQIRSPEFSSMTGNDAYDSMLETFTVERFEEDLVACNSFVDRAKALLSEDAITENQRLNLNLFVCEVSTFVDGFNFKGFYFPINFLEGVQIDFQRLADWMSFKSTKDYTNLITRYEKFAAYADQLIVMLDRGVSEGYVNHAISMEGVVDQFKGHDKPAEETAFWEPFSNEQFSKIVTNPGEQKCLQARAKTAIETSIRFGMTKLANYLKSEYLRKTRPEIGATSLPNGEEFYNACLKFHTSTDLSAKEIHEIGLREVDRIEANMRSVIKELGHDNLSIKEFGDMLRKDPKFTYKTPEELMAAFTNMCADKINPQLKKLFWNPPNLEYKIIETPKTSPNAPAAYYILGTADGSRPGTFFVNTNKYESQPNYEVVTLSLHELNPGHHLEGSYGLVQADRPSFRRHMEDRIYSQTPTRFPINTAFVEGWGLYSEKLGFDLGLYDNLYDRYGHYSFEIFRACRLVVDTGIHALGWSQDQAVNFMLEHTAISKEHVSDEVKRYITWPGQACGYKMGEIKISELRKKAEQSLGDSFDIRDFHDIVLRSAGPLFVLEEEVNRYIKNKTK